MTYEPKNRPIGPPALRPQGSESPIPAPSKPKSGGPKNKKIANSLVALGSAAIVSVYGLGYLHTQPAEALFSASAPVIAVATTAPTATDAASPVAAYQSPLSTPTATALAPATATVPATARSSQSAASATASPSAASVAPTATTAPATATKTPATATPAAATTAAYKDGTYTGTGTSRHGNITASVVVQGGKIVSANITQCGTRYPCSDIAALPGQVVTRQSAAVDLVSGATDSSHAYQGAIQTALAKAKA